MLGIIENWDDAQAELRRICDRTHDASISDKEVTVRKVLEDIQARGDEALLKFTAEFDRVELEASQLRVTGAELDAAYQQVPQRLLNAIRRAQQQIEAFHQKRVPKSWVSFEDNGITLGKRYTAVDRAGLYVPGGRASYPSTVLMNAVPAKVAGVDRIVMVTPPKSDGSLNAAVLVAAQEAGVSEIYRVGGSQAVAALAYGTATIPKVDVISGPGNIYVTLAKRLVYGTVGIDSLAGPSEVLIIADSSADPAYVAADLLAQAEHDPLAAAILITTDGELARGVAREVENQLDGHPRRFEAEKSIINFGSAIVVDTLEQAAELSNQFAPEHLELEVTEPWDLVPLIRHAGAIFLGHSTPEAVGDYLAGPNHTLPTSGAARYASALGVETFMKYSSLIQYSDRALADASQAIQALANAEGLVSHSESVRLRSPGEPDSNQ
ncbi:MAG: histidinol dehydrogenase [Cyanobacteria bacterium P01_C01_bin.89]